MFPLSLFAIDFSKFGLDLVVGLGTELTVVIEAQLFIKAAPSVHSKIF